VSGENPSCVYLMYHELELPGGRLCQNEPGYVRYIVSAADFRAQMQWLKSNGWQGMNVTQALSHFPGPGVALTFDDGCETDLITAAPLLRELGFRATSYITVGFLGKPGYLTPAKVRELSESGMEVGCHSLTHPYLTDLPEELLRAEIADAKKALEQMTGKPVDHFSCPGGRWSHRVAAVAREAGYRSVATSRAEANSSATGPFCLGRVAVMRGTSLEAFQEICKGRGLWKLQFGEWSRSTAKLVLGNAVYDRIRSRMLSRQGK
jgi:peptidoglycan/xylan/chitin deacetylase (PgdA/CDA1 family)